MPFITEEIYQEYFRKNEKVKSIHISEWPEAEKVKDSSDFDVLVGDLSFIRQEKSKNKLPLNHPVKEFITPNCKIINNYKEDFMSASGAVSMKLGKEYKVEFPDR
jgi:valyl-tRNA synthetase